MATKKASPSRKSSSKKSSGSKAGSKKSSSKKAGSAKSGSKKSSGSSGSKKSSAKKSSAKRGSGKRELIDTGTSKRYVRRDGEGQFKESVDVGRSLSADRKRKSSKKVKSGYGDRGDR